MFLPQSAVDLLKQNEKLSVEEERALQDFIIPFLLDESLPPPVAETEVTSEINGKTSFQQVLNMGLSREELTRIVGSLPDQLNMAIKDYAVEKSLNFPEIKEAFLQTLEGSP